MNVFSMLERSLPAYADDTFESSRALRRETGDLPTGIQCFGKNPR